jgi:hypothetical protein
MPQATEAQEQEALFRWVNLCAVKQPELLLLYHIPNEGRRSGATGAAMRRQGLRAGVPDLCLPVASAGFHGLYIELKRKNGRPTESQTRWIDALRGQGYKAEICYGWVAASELIKNYLGGRYEWKKLP